MVKEYLLNATDPHFTLKFKSCEGFLRIHQRYRGGFGSRLLDCQRMGTALFPVMDYNGLDASITNVFIGSMWT